jgi:hypothetical protein
VGDRVWRRQLPPVGLDDGVRAARTVLADNLTPAPESDRERYANEATLVTERNDPETRI